MKKIAALFAVLLLVLSVFAVSVNPSLDGRVIVAGNNVFPSGGFYGKAPGYLPGDTVVVTNHINGLTCEVLILGSQDASEGVAILLSPEAANKLQIQKGKDVYVKVQKKQSIPYEKSLAKAGNGLENNVADPDKTPSVLPGESEKALNESLSARKRHAKAAETPKVVEPVEELSEEIPEEVPEVIVEEIVEEPVVEVVEVQEEIPELIVEEAVVAPVVEPVIESTVAEEAYLEETDPQYPDPVEINADDAKGVFAQLMGTEVKELASDFNSKYQNIIFKKFSDTPKAKQLKSKTYYIQLSNSENEKEIDDLIGKYGKNYPIKLVEDKNSSYDVMVGPLNDDEYELVFARFKNAFKDSYIRKR